MQLILFKDTDFSQKSAVFQNSFLYLLSNGNQDYTSDRQRMYRFRSRYTFSGFCLQLHEGEIACISGQSGRGKTSLLNAILGFVPLKAGSITVNGILLEKELSTKFAGKWHGYRKNWRFHRNG